MELNNDNDDYDFPILYDPSDCDYNLPTLYDENYENNFIYTNATIENNVHDQSSNNNVHDLNLPSMRAHCMLNLGLMKKGFNMGHLNIQGIQNKVEQIDLMLNSSENDIQLLGLSESKLNANHPNNFFAIKNFQFFRKDRTLSADRPEQGGGIIVYLKDDIKCVRRLT